MRFRRANIGIMEKKMETTILTVYIYVYIYRVCTGMMGNGNYYNSVQI